MELNRIPRFEFVSAFPFSEETEGGGRKGGKEGKREREREREQGEK